MNRIHIVLAAGLMSLIVLTTPAEAGRVTIAPGLTSQGGWTFNIGMAFDWRQRWFESETGYLSGYFEAGYTAWEGGRHSDTVHSAAAIPVFVYYFNDHHLRPFLELGVGAAVFSSSRVGDRNLGSSLHFEDRFGAGIRLDNNQRLTLRVLHYSNAGFKSPNQGIESWSLVYSRRY